MSMSTGLIALSMIVVSVIGLVTIAVIILVEVSLFERQILRQIEQMEIQFDVESEGSEEKHEEDTLMPTADELASWPVMEKK